MALPNWLSYNLGGRVAGIVGGVGTFMVIAWAVRHAFPYSNARLKNQSALYSGRKVPDGEDSWKY